MYVDPDGRFFFSAFIPFVGMYMDAACWGAVIGAASYTMNVATTPGGFDNWNWGQFGKSVGLNALSNVATAGVGDIFGGQGNFFKEFSRGLTQDQGFLTPLLVGQSKDKLDSLCWQVG